MAVLNINSINLSYGTQSVLTNISLQFEIGQKLGVVGVNGAGKSTLLKIIAEKIQPDSGVVSVSKGLTLGFLEQDSSISDCSTLYSAVLESFQHFVEMEDNLKDLELKMSTITNPDELDKIMRRYDYQSEQFRQCGGFEYISRVQGIIRGLGFSDEEFSAPVKHLSGGQKTRLFMARLLSQEPDILLLDEPTNHLDITAMQWLESFLKDYKKTVIMVSHDRYFLDGVCNSIFEIEHSNGTFYSGNYSAYVKTKQENAVFAQRLYENQQKEIRRIEDIIEQQRRWNREKNIVTAESRMKALARMEKVSAPTKDAFKVKFNLQSSIVSGSDVLEINNLSCGYNHVPLVNNISITVKRNEKVFILGPNGCGKTTLLKTLVGTLAPITGSVKFGHKVKIGYYDQEFSGLDFSSTVFDELLVDSGNISETEIRNTLALFGFSGNDVFKQISVLSGGEKSRVLLSKLILSKPNLLIMDEPTNHLDINTREILETALLEFDGTIICISHDRYFINKISTRIMEFTGDEIFNFLGSYQDFLEFKRKNPIKVAVNNCLVTTESKENFLASKEQKSKERKLQRQIQDAKSKIEGLEKRLFEIEDLLNNPEHSSNHIYLHNLLSEKDDVENSLLMLYEELEELSNENNTCNASQ